MSATNVSGQLKRNIKISVAMTVKKLEMLVLNKKADRHTSISLPEGQG